MEIEPINSVAGGDQQNSIIADEEDPLRNISDEDFFRHLPPGYIFFPTDTELIVEYLAKKVNNHPLPRNKIFDVKLYAYHPQELFRLLHDSGNNSTNKECYFFTPRNRKYKNGKRPDRAAGNGYWKATGADKNIVDSEGNIVGFRKALVFYVGKPPKGAKTLWIMHEFRVNNSPQCDTSEDAMRLDDWVLCKIYHKMGKTNMTTKKPSMGNLEDNADNIGEDNVGNIDEEDYYEEDKDVVIDDVPEETCSNTEGDLETPYYPPLIYNQLSFPPTNNNIIASKVNINHHHQLLQQQHHANLAFGSPYQHQIYVDNNNLQGNATLIHHNNTYQPHLAPANPGLQIHNPQYLGNLQVPQPMSINGNPYYLQQNTQATQPRSINGSYTNNDSTTKTQTDDDEEEYYDTNQFLS